MSWNTIEDMFCELHKKQIPYIILRNYEEIDEDNFYSSGHADIDFLTVNGRKFSKTIHAVPRFVEDDGIHYIVKIAGTEVVIDTRSVGDGYYDKKWEKALLASRLLKDGRFYISDNINYYYSLVYHAILQKKELSCEYLCRLNTMAYELGIKADSEETHLSVLQKFMKENNYYYTWPYDIHVPLRTELIDKKFIRKQLNVYRRDFITKFLQFGSEIKHIILRY